MILIWWIELFISACEINLNSYTMADLNNFGILLKSGQVAHLLLQLVSTNNIGAIKTLINFNAC